MCTHPDCSHYLAKYLVLGKRALCPKCNETFVMDSIDLMYKTVVCKYCHDGKQSEKLRKMRDRVNELASMLGKTAEISSITHVTEEKLHTAMEEQFLAFQRDIAIQQKEKEEEQLPEMLIDKPKRIDL